MATMCLTTDTLSMSDFCLIFQTSFQNDIQLTNQPDSSLNHDSEPPPSVVIGLPHRGTGPSPGPRLSQEPWLKIWSPDPEP